PYCDSGEGVMPTSVRSTKRQKSLAVAGAPPRPRTALRCLGAALISSALLWLSYFPADQGWLAWVGLAPWLLLVRAELSNGRRSLAAWLAGLALCVRALSWMRVAHDAMFYFWLLLSLYCSWYLPLALLLVRRQ